MRVGVLVLALMVSSPAAAETLKSTEQTESVCAQAAKLFAAGEYDQAYQSLVPHWPLPEEEILSLGYQTKTQLGMVASRYGSAVGAEHVDNVAAGESLVRHIFLIKYEKHALKLSCVFYKPRGEWLINHVTWDDKPQALLGVGG